MLLQTVAADYAAMPFDDVPLGVGAAPPDAGWAPLRPLLEPGGPVLRAAIDELTVSAGGFREVAVTHACAALAEALTWALVTSITLHSRAWRYEPDRTWVHRGPGDLWDGIHVTASPVAMTVADPLCTGPTDEVVVVERHEQVVDWAATAVAPILRCAVDALHEAGRFGRRGLWGIIAGEVAFAALVAAHRAHTDDRHALGTASRFLDGLAAHTGEQVPRPAVRPVLVAGAYRLAPTKAVCCLRYRVPARAAEPDPLCLTCPKRPELDRDERYTRWVAWLSGAGVEAT